MRIHSFPQRSQGFTLIELLVVISIIANLAGMLLPVIGVVREMARQQQCGKNQSQILGSMVAYGTAEDVAWPNPRGASWKIPTINGPIAEADAPKYTAACFELVAASQTLPNALFRCPSAASGGPDKNLKASERRADTTWGWEGVAKVNYGFDWASPADPPAARVVLADRDLKNHKEEVMACFGDAHVKKLKSLKTGTPAAPKTVGAITNPNRPVINPDAKGAWDQEDDAANLFQDDIYSGEKDAASADEVLTPGGGHHIRAFVK